jgi:rubrerythrin
LKIVFITGRREVSIMMNLLSRLLDQDQHPWGVLSLIFSNFEQVARKQRRLNQERIFSALSRSLEIQAQRMGAEHDGAASIDRFLDDFQGVLEEDINKNYEECAVTAEQLGVRGSQRAIIWGKKVTTIQNSLIKKYKTTPNFLPEGQKIHMCEACGFVMIGEVPPQICPVCKAPAGRFVSIKSGKGR